MNKIKKNEWIYVTYKKKNKNKNSYHTTSIIVTQTMKKDVEYICTEFGNLSLDQLADYIKCDHSDIKRFENIGNTVTEQTIKKIERLIGRKIKK